MVKNRLSKEATEIPSSANEMLVERELLPFDDGVSGDCWVQANKSTAKSEAEKSDFLKWEEIQ